MYSFTQMIAQGYRFGAPTAEAEKIDSEIASGIECPRCGRSMRYEGYCRRGDGQFSYIALAVCDGCGHKIEF